MLPCNYPFIFLAYGVGGIVGPIMAGAFRDAGSWMPAFIISGILCLIATVLALSLKPLKATTVEIPEIKESREPVGSK